MSTDIFKVNDKVLYIKECHDHFANNRLLKIGNTYTIGEVNQFDVYLQEAKWWVSKECLQLGYVDNLNPEQLRLLRIYNKIHQLDNKFNEAQKAKKQSSVVKSNFKEVYQDWLERNRDLLRAATTRTNSVTGAGGTTSVVFRYDSGTVTSST